MNKEKLTYLSPETETLVVRFEAVVCTSPGGYGSSGSAGSSLGEEDEIKL
jgi:hypothetical protein